MTRSGPGEWRGLGLRVATALVLAPPALAALYFGSPYSDVLVLAAAGVAAWEWARMCRGGRLDPTGGLVVAAVTLAVAAGSLGDYLAAGWLAAAGAVAVTVMARRTGRSGAVWPGLGVVYLAAACLAFLWLRQDPTRGRELVFWLLAVVWSTDVGAYFAGRALGGPKLAPSISPNKTWAGLGGGMLAAAGVGVAAAAMRGDDYLRLVLLSIALAVVAQVGDLFESRLKRRFGVKDSSALIPGHGGVLDRIDGILAGALVFGGGIWLTGTAR
ncbi:MAG: phosphatidate cytidylyltransferase [Kiloniellaceae bacterium]